jgi:hypothetical protein
VDRCALFVDAGYVLADGAMAVHGTRRRESVSWDHEGLLQFLSSLATERSGLPLLRCYWYEGSADGRRTAEHDGLADLPGVKLRLTKTRPGREGVESEIHRDLAALAHNKAVSDAMVVSAEEELAPVISDVQDLGLRVTLLHIAADGNWTISRTLRQECDDIVEISAAHLRPYVELISGAEPANGDDQEGGALIPLHPQGNGGRSSAYTAQAQPPAQGSYQAPPAIYTAPVVAEYQRPVPQLPRHAPEEPAAAYDQISYDQAPRYDDVPDDRQPAQPAAPDDPARDLLAGLAAMPVTRQEAGEGWPDQGQSGGQDVAVIQDLPAGQDIPARQDVSAQLEPSGRPNLSAARPAFTAREIYGAPVAVPVPVGAPAPTPVSATSMPPSPLPAPVSAAPDDRPAEFPVSGLRGSDASGYNPGALREPSPVDQDGFQLASGATGSAQIRRLPTRGNGSGASAAYPALGQPGAAAPGSGPLGLPPGQPVNGQVPGGQAEPPAAGQPSEPGAPLTPTYTPASNNAFSGPQPAVGGGTSAMPAGPVPGGPNGVVPSGLAAVPSGPMPVGPVAAGPAPGGPVPGALAPGGPVPAGPIPGGPVPGGPGSAGMAAGGVVPAGQPSGPMAQPALGQAGPGPLPGGPGQAVPFPVGPGGQLAPGGQDGPVSPVNPGGQPGSAGQLGPAGVPNAPVGPPGPGGPGGPVNPGAVNPAGPAGQNMPAFAPAPGQPGLSLADAVQAAHEEGQEFGGSVARDAPALWLEAVLARKPRMPSDLEARLLQGSSLPIDFLLHDEVRHALRRGFWDALERARR